MVASQVPVGPFIGGLNTFADAAAIADNELTTAQNVEVDPDGTLRSRSPFVNSSSLPANGGWRLLGVYTDSNGNRFPIGSAPSAGVYYWNGSWNLITNTLDARDVVQYQGKLYLLAAYSGHTSGTWDGTTFTADATMPKGNSITVYKGRIWIAGLDDKVYYSALQTQLGGSFWTSGVPYGGTIRMGEGDGQANLYIRQAYNQLIVFRANSIYSIAYATDPVQYTQTPISTSVGLASGAFTTTDPIEFFEGVFYFVFRGAAYTLTGSSVQQINGKVPFVPGTVFAASDTNFISKITVSAVNRKIIFGYYDVLYVLNLRSNTWTTWTTKHIAIGKIVPWKMNTAPVGTTTGVEQMQYLTYPAYATFPCGQVSLLFTDDPGSSTEGGGSGGFGYNVLLRTKVFDYASPDKNKRLFKWGVNCSTYFDLTGRAIPSALQNNTYARTSTGHAPVVTGAGQTATPRRYIAFPASLRFRTIQYELSQTVAGNESSRLRVYSIETYVSQKATEAAQVA